MARKKTTSAPQSARPQAESKELDEQPAPEANEPDSPRKMSKTDAIRAAMAEGIESPGDGVDFIRKNFGLEMSKQHFSATKSKLKSMEGQGEKKADPAKAAPKAGAPKAAAERKPEALVERQTPQGRAAGGEGDLLDLMEQMKPLIAEHGADKLKRIVDLLE